MAKPQYGPAHRATRALWQPIVDRGEAHCTEPICLLADRWIAPGSAWDLAHNRDTGGYRGPAHARCNRAEGAHHVNAKRRRRKASSNQWKTSRRW